MLYEVQNKNDMDSSVIFKACSVILAGALQPTAHTHRRVNF